MTARVTRASDWLLALAGGVLLTLMTRFNGELAAHTTAVYASWVAHGTGAVVALLLVALTSRVLRSRRDPLSHDPLAQDSKAPLWFYLGGIPGAFVVVLSAVTVNSSLGLSGTIALMLTGQIVFGLASDRFGLLRIPRRRITRMDLTVAGLVLAGSVLIVAGGA
ncbi:DMT family transporter [Streptomyces sp. NPDC058579]|uniref:DMT family transporter n=1 Tax=Streptomyces sp. NPDC058579 TaxID=3346548 RepID=UPI003652C60D